jgi:uncharacterized membrane protein
MAVPYQAVADMHIASMKTCNHRNLWTEDICAHYVVRRYAEFTASMLALNADYGDPQIDHILERLRSAVCHLMLRVAHLYPATKQHIMFLINNYDMVLTVLKEAGVGGGKYPATKQHIMFLINNYAMVLTVLKEAGVGGGKYPATKQHIMFLINNYDTVLKEARVGGGKYQGLS